MAPLTSSCTLPVAVDGDTVAVNVTDWPKTIEIALEPSEVVAVVDTWLTVCVSGAEVLTALFVSPRYLATMLCDPIDNDDVVKVA